MRVPRWLPAAAVTLLAAAIAWFNRGERVAVDVGFTTFYRAPFTIVLFVAFLAGMLSMLALSLRNDMRVRDELRARGLLDAPHAPEPSPAWAEPEAPDATAAFDARDDTPASAAEDRTAIHPRYDRDPAA
ncbi:MAG: LapA family protein [Gemmatimonadetes bacterium]|nr:LapA family protein [Gemmatimonadota bacterium]